MSFKRYNEIQAILIARFVKRTGRDEMEWVEMYAARFSKKYRKLIK